MTLKRELGEALVAAVKQQTRGTVAAFVRECVRKELAARGVEVTIPPPKPRGRKPRTQFGIVRSKHTLRSRAYRAKLKALVNL